MNQWEHLGIENEQLEEIKVQVREKYPSVEFPNVYSDALWRGINSRTKVEDRQAIVMVGQDGTESVATISSLDYMIIPHEWAIWRFEEVLKESPQYGEPKIELHLYSEGAKMVVNTTFPEVTKNIGDDKLNPRAGIKNSYDMSTEWETFFGAMVLRCTNGLMMFKKLSNGGGKHRMSLDLKANIAQIQQGMEKLEQQYGIWENWLNIELSKSQTMEMLEGSPFSDAQVDKILQLPELGQHESLSLRFEKEMKVSKWFVNSIATQYMEHEMENTPSRLNLIEKWTNHIHRNFS